jgi:hypothetical protein
LGKTADVRRDIRILLADGTQPVEIMQRLSESADLIAKVMRADLKRNPTSQPLPTEDYVPWRLSQYASAVPTRQGDVARRL